MKKTNLDYETKCKACESNNLERYDTCPACGDGRHAPSGAENGTVNRYRDAPDGEVRMMEWVDDSGIVKIWTKKERRQSNGGFDGQFNGWTPKNVPGDIHPDLKDRLQNQLGQNTPYEFETPHGVVRIEDGELPNNISGSVDLTAEQIHQWAKARKDKRLQSTMGTIIHEPESPF